MRMDFGGVWCAICKRMVYVGAWEHRQRHAEEMERQSRRAAEQRRAEEQQRRSTER